MVHGDRRRRDARLGSGLPSSSAAIPIQFPVVTGVHVGGQHPAQLVCLADGAGEKAAGGGEADREGGGGGSVQLPGRGKVGNT